MDGSSNPHDILTVLGEKELAKYLVDEVQEVYRLQGVKINDKHIEVIVRQMLRRVRDQGRRATPTSWSASRSRSGVFEEENERVHRRRAASRRSAEPLLLGITKASLSTESFISAASFQETTKVLTEAAHRRQGRLPARPQGERHHGPAHPGRDRAAALPVSRRLGSWWSRARKRRPKCRSRGQRNSA